MKFFLTLCFVITCTSLQANTHAFVDDMTQEAEKQKDKVAQFLERLEQNKEKPVKVHHQGLEDLLEGKSCHHCSGHKTTKSSPSLPHKQKSQIIVFATLSLSDTALKSYAQDLSKVGGRLVIRGLVDDSFKRTKKRLDQLGIAVDIDPPLFDDFGIAKQVPVIVHTKLHNGDYQVKHHDRIAGQVSLKHAVEVFAKEGDLAVQPSWLKSMRGF